MKTLKTLLPLACLLLMPLAALATPIAYPFRAMDNSGALVAGATVTIGATALTAGSAVAVPAAAGEKLLTTNAAPGAAVSITLLDYGTGDYALVYDPATQGELYIPLSISKAGSTITGSAALIALVAAADSSTVVAVSMQTTAANQQTNMTTGLTTQGYTAARAAKLDNVDVLTSSRMPTFTYTAPVNPTDYARNNVSPTWYTAPPSLPGDYLSAAEQTKLAFLDTAISSRSTYAGGPVASVTGSIGSISGITFPANFGTFAVDGSGRVTLVPGQSVLASNLPTDYQQRGIAVTLPPTAPTGYGGTGGGSDTPGTTLILSRIGIPAGASLAADIAAVKSDTGGLAAGVAALPAAVWAFTASDGLTHQQSDALRTAVLLRGFLVSYNASTRTQVTTYFKADGATALAATTVVYDVTGRPLSRTTAFSSLP